MTKAVDKSAKRPQKGSLLAADVNTSVAVNKGKSEKVRTVSSRRDLSIPQPKKDT